MYQHRAIGFLQHVPPNLNLIIGADGNQVRVERGVMQRAEGDAVRNDRRAERLAIADARCGREIVLFEIPLKCSANSRKIGIGESGIL